jgi:hypothetical protein
MSCQAQFRVARDVTEGMPSNRPAGSGAAPIGGPNGWQNLCVDVLWPGNAAEAYAAIDRFEDTWWVANSHLGVGRLAFTYRLV